MILQHYLPLHTYLHIFVDEKGNLYFKISLIVKYNIRGVIRGAKRANVLSNIRKKLCFHYSQTNEKLNCEI